jgi:hypothetical protein
LCNESAVWHCWKHLRNDLFGVVFSDFPEFEGHFGNNTLATAIPLLETIRNHKGPNQANKEVRGPQPCF